MIIFCKFTLFFGIQYFVKKKYCVFEKNRFCIILVLLILIIYIDEINHSTLFIDLAAKIKEAFNRQFYKCDVNEYDTGSQTANAIAIYMDLVEPENRLAVWFYSGLAGIQQTEHSVAYREIIIKPEIVGDISHVSVTYECPYGKFISDLRKEGDIYYLDVEIPANTTANVFSPNNNITGLTENNQKFKAKTTKDGAVKIGSGKYYFKIKMV